MRYVLARFEIYQRELAYRIYISDALQNISENTAKFGSGRYMKVRFADIIMPQPEDDRTSEEIISHIREKLRD